jgi:hypothetical protein
MPQLKPFFTCHISEYFLFGRNFPQKFPNIEDSHTAMNGNSFYSNLKISNKGRREAI